MKSKLLTGMPLLFMFLLACTSEPVEVEFAEIMDDDIARFNVWNNTENDIMKISFEVTFLDASGDQIETDTVSFNKNSDVEGNILPFIAADSSTFFVWKGPGNVASAKGRVLHYE